MISLPPTGLSEATVYPWVFWFLWTGRNKLLYDNRLIPEQDIATQAIKEARIWQAAQQSKDKPPRPSPSGPPLGIDPFTAHCLVDAAWNPSTRGSGFGCIFKDTNSHIVHQSSSNRCFVGSVLMAEALAVKAALQVAISLGIGTLTVWSDSKTLVSALSSNSKILEVQAILFDIAFLCNAFSGISFSFVPRLLNAESDALAKIALMKL